MWTRLLLLLLLPLTVADYNETIAVRLLHFAAAAYGGRQEECMKSVAGADSDWVVHSATAMNCDIFKQPCGLVIFHSVRDKETVFSFRGTEGVIQLFNEGLQAALPKMSLLGMGNINRYFLDAHWSTWRIVETYLMDERFASHSISLTGHSLGGALASIAALRVATTGLRPSSSLRLYTFGEPRVGDAQFARNLDELVHESYRIVHSLDVIPHVPVCSKDKNGDCNESGFYHHGTEIWYPDESMEIGKELYEICDDYPLGEDSSCSNSIRFGVSNLFHYLQDHKRYFGVVVSEFGENGCTEKVTGKHKEESIFKKMFKTIKKTIKKYIPFL